MATNQFDEDFSTEMDYNDEDDFCTSRSDWFEERYYDYEERTAWGRYEDRDCGEGYSCSECTNFGCNANPNN